MQKKHFPTLLESWSFFNKKTPCLLRQNQEAKCFLCIPQLLEGPQLLYLYCLCALFFVQVATSSMPAQYTRIQIIKQRYFCQQGVLLAPKHVMGLATVAFWE